MRTQKQPAELVIDTGFGILRIPCTFAVDGELERPPAPAIAVRAGVEDVRNFVAPEYSELPVARPTDDEIAETIRRGRRAVLPDPTERDQPKSKAELARKLANRGKPCPGCNERVGPRTKICMCGHTFYPAGAAA